MSNGPWENLRIFASALPHLQSFFFPFHNLVSIPILPPLSPSPLTTSNHGHLHVCQSGFPLGHHHQPHLQEAIPLVLDRNWYLTQHTAHTLYISQCGEKRNPKTKTMAAVLSITDHKLFTCLFPHYKSASLCSTRSSLPTGNYSLAHWCDQQCSHTGGGGKPNRRAEGWLANLTLSDLVF